MSSANFPHPAESGGYGEPTLPGSRGEPTLPGSRGELVTAGGHDVLATIASDPGVRRHARRVAGELAEDTSQETWYAVAQARASEPTGNLRGCFYRVMENTSRRLARGNRPAEHAGRRLRRSRPRPRRGR